MNFDFSSAASSNFSSNGGSYLKPYDIYTVNLTKIEKTELKGKKDPNAVYPIVQLEFTEVGDNKRTFTDKLFIPTTEDDLKRPVFENSNGHEYSRPSRMELFQYTLMQLVHVLNPTGEEKIKEVLPKVKTVDQFTDLIVKALVGKEKVATKLKLVGRVTNGVTYAALPAACGLTKENEIFPINFVGENLSFSSYEESKRKEYQNAKPTSMTKSEETPDDAPKDEVDLSGIEL